MSLLPYFKWFPADAAGDEKYACLNHEELGIWHRLYDLAWQNDGLPIELSELAGLLHVSRKYLDRVWPKLEASFPILDKRRRNPRQERERNDAISKSEHNKRFGNSNALKTEDSLNANETRSQHERIANETRSKRVQTPRAYESECSTIKDFTLEGEILKNGNGRGSDFDKWYAVYWNHAGKQDAKKAFAAAVKECGVELLIAATTESKARFERTDAWQWRVNMLPATFLRGRRWEDQAAPAVATDNGRPRRLTPTEEAIAEAKERRRHENAT
jgi:hypothetical protein